MDRKVVLTADGSHTLYLSEWDEHYHSVHGAIQESMHVFINKGLKEVFKEKNEVRLLEIGFGTGLNAFLTWQEAEQQNKKIWYTGVEAFPLSLELVKQLNYLDALKQEKRKTDYLRMHELPGGEMVELTAAFHLKKLESKIQELQTADIFDLLYFDAFAPRVQPELWTPEIFQQMHRLLAPGGILVSYCAKGAVKRALKESGFKVEALEGPPGKREITRALKI